MSVGERLSLGSVQSPRGERKCDAVTVLCGLTEDNQAQTGTRDIDDDEGNAPPLVFAAALELPCDLKIVCVGVATSCVTCRGVGEVHRHSALANCGC